MKLSEIKMLMPALLSSCC